MNCALWRIVAPVIIVLMPLFGCEKGTEFKTFAKYGFRFRYPKDLYVLYDSGLLADGSKRSYVVAVGDGDQVPGEFVVRCESHARYDLQEGLESHDLSRMMPELFADYEKGELQETIRLGHPVLCQFFTATRTDSGRVCGIVSIFNCDRTARAFVLMTMRNGIGARQDILDHFQRYLNSFVCH